MVKKICPWILPSGRGASSDWISIAKEEADHDIFFMWSFKSTCIIKRGCQLCDFLIVNALCCLISVHLRHDPHPTKDKENPIATKHIDTFWGKEWEEESMIPWMKSEYLEMMYVKPSPSLRETDPIDILTVFSHKRKREDRWTDQTRNRYRWRSDHIEYIQTFKD